jgi:hypothetical protein
MRFAQEEWQEAKFQYREKGECRVSVAIPFANSEFDKQHHGQAVAAGRKGFGGVLGSNRLHA